MNPTPEISVIVPYHNEAETITTTLDLIARQSYLPREVLFIDSASTDESHRIVDDWIGKQGTDSASIVFRNIDAGTNVPSSSKNAGVRLSLCDTVAFMDCGLLFGTDWLRKQVEFMNTGHYAVVSGGVVLEGTNSWDRAAAAQTYGYRRFRPCIPSTVAKKKVFGQTGPFHEGLRAGYDVEWPEKLIRNGIARGINRDVVVCYNGTNYADRPSTLFRKSVSYAKGTLGLSGYKIPYAYLVLCFLCIFAALAHPPAFLWLGLTYLAGRGYIVPAVKSRNVHFFSEHPLLLLTLPAAGILIDAGKMVGMGRRIGEGVVPERFRDGRESALVGAGPEQASKKGSRSRSVIAGEDRICRVATVPITFATLLYDQVRYLMQKGMNITIVSSPEPLLLQVASELETSCRAVPLSRKMDPLTDVKAVFQLRKMLLQNRCCIVHSSTPKAGLISALAGKMARTPVRLHTYTGQVWAEKRGVTRRVLKACDALIARLNTACYADSHSQMDFLVREKVVSGRKIQVLGDGSIGGVDLNRFNPESVPKKVGVRLKKDLGISDSAITILFVGRVTRDKGVCELVDAFEGLGETFSNLHLVLVGPFEPERDPLPAETVGRIERNPAIHTVGFQKNVETYMAISDIFCLPSYREGFGSVAIEAGAMGLPTVATRIVGLVDAIVEGKTGILVSPKSSAAVAEALERLISDKSLRRQMGRAARERAVECFDARRVNELVRTEYIRWLATVSRGGQAEMSKSK